MGFAEYYVNICEAFGCGGHIYYFQTNCRGGPRLMYYLKLILYPVFQIQTRGIARCGGLLQQKTAIFDNHPKMINMPQYTNQSSDAYPRAQLLQSYYVTTLNDTTLVSSRF